MNNATEKHWILLRGLARESKHWGAFIPKLQAMFPDAKITLLDLPGTGCLYQETSPNTIAQITHQVRAQAGLTASSMMCRYAGKAVPTRRSGS